MPTTEQLLEKILFQLEKLNEAQKPRRVITHGEHLLLAKLVPGIKGAFGSSAWTTRELLGLPVFQELTGLDSRELGTLLSKSAGLDIAGFAIESAGKDCGRVLWALRVVDNGQPTTLRPATSVDLR